MAKREVPYHVGRVTKLKDEKRELVVEFKPALKLDGVKITRVPLNYDAYAYINKSWTNAHPYGPQCLGKPISVPDRALQQVAEYIHKKEDITDLEDSSLDELLQAEDELPQLNLPMDLDANA